MNKLQLITKGILKENPTFVLILGMCPTLATTTSAINGMGMGAATMAVLIMSNIVISLIKNLPLIVRPFAGAFKGLKGEKSGSERTARDVPMPIVLGAIVVLTLLVWLIPAIPVSFLGAMLVVVFGFFFATVSSRMVGLVGSSNNPVSGMAIATLLVSTLILKFTGAEGIGGMTAAIAIGSIICIVAAISGDTSQDLKTGYILGATPKKQQIGEVIGVVASALAIGGTLYLLDSAWGFGSEELAAPQATLMKMIVEGVMSYRYIPPRSAQRLHHGRRYRSSRIRQAQEARERKEGDRKRRYPLLLGYDRG